MVACTSELTLKVSDVVSIKVTFFAKDSSITKTRIATYADGDIELEQFKRWVERNRTGWEPYFATVAVGDMMISGERFTLYLNNDFAVINISNLEGEHAQYSKRIAIDEFVQFTRP